MTSLPFLTKIAWNNLRRGGQRAVVAVLCVAFGVLSLVSMMMLSAALERMLVERPQDLIGADISMERASEPWILPEHVAALDALRQAGVVDEATLVAYSSTLTFRLPGSTRLYFPAAGIGIDPPAYPPVGTLTVERPGSVGLPTLLKGTGDMLITRDIALEHGLRAGDRLILSDLGAGPQIEGIVRGIVSDTPNHKGSKIYYSLDTAAALGAGNSGFNTILVTASDPSAARDALEQAGWRVFLAEDMARVERNVQDFFASTLNGAGVLGLLVGGVGIANTMQVLLQRRKREVAIWKSIGYRSLDLQVMFSLEAGLLGLLGSLAGAAAGAAVSAGLVNLFSRTSTMLIRWELSPAPVLIGVLVGVATTVIFALWAIVSSSQVSPAALLRESAAPVGAVPWLKGAGLLLALALPFTAAVTLVMGSVWKSAAVLLGALSGLVVLGGVLAAGLGVLVRVLPVRRLPLLHMACTNLRRRGLAPVFAMVALFVGVVSLTFASTVTLNAERLVAGVDAAMPEDNLVVLAPAGAGSRAVDAVRAAGAEKISAGYQTRAQMAQVVGLPEQRLPGLLIARSQLTGYTVEGAPWGSRPEGVYVSRFYGRLEGETLEIILRDGAVHRLPVVGVYDEEPGINFQMEAGILLASEQSLAMANPDQEQILARVPEEKLETAVRSLSEALPQATVINRMAYMARFTDMYHNLFWLAASMAGLALLAGALLVANSVSLAMIHRHYEMGLLRALGYTRQHVLTTLMVEYTLMALVALAAGLGLVRGYIWLVGLQNPMAGALLAISPQTAGLVFFVTIGLTLLAVLLVTWNPTRVSPLVVLNDKE